MPELPAVEVLRRGCWRENYCIRTDGPPYDANTRWAAKGEELVWNGYKVHLSETCHTPDTDTAHPRGEAEAGQQHDAPARPAPEELPNLITNVATTDATIPDVAMTDPIDRCSTAGTCCPGSTTWTPATPPTPPPR